MIGGSYEWYGFDWSSQVYERVNGEWIEKCNLNSPGKPHFIESYKPEEGIGAIVIDYNQTIHMDTNFLTVNFANAPANLNVNLNISFPENVCWNVSINLSESSINHCHDTFINISLNRGNSEVVSMGHFCGHENSYNNHVIMAQVNPGGILTLDLITSNKKTTEQGFILKLCKEDCCYQDGKPSFWHDWGEWSNPNVCPYKEHINEGLRKKERTCKINCKCNHETVKVDTNNRDKLAKGNFKCLKWYINLCSA